MRWRRDDRQQPDDRPDLPAEEWLSQFRPVRPDSLTSADRDAIVRPPVQPAPGARGSDWAAGPPETGRSGRGQRRARPDGGWADGGRADESRSGVGRSGVGRSDVGRSDVGRSDVGRVDVPRADGAQSDGRRFGRQRADDALAQPTALPAAAAPDRESPRADRPMRSVTPDRRDPQVREYPGRSDAEFVADRDNPPSPRPDWSPLDRAWSSPREDATSQLPVADSRRATRDDRPDYLNRTGPTGVPSGAEPRPQIHSDRGPDPEPRRPAYGDLGRGLRAPGELREDSRGYRDDGSGRAADRGGSSLEPRGYRDDGSGRAADRGGSRLEPRGYRDDGPGRAPDRGGSRLEPRGYRDDGPGRAPDRGGLGLEPRGYRDDARGTPPRRTHPERADYALQSDGYANGGRPVPQRPDAEPGTDAYRNGGRPARDRPVPDRPRVIARCLIAQFLIAPRVNARCLIAQFLIAPRVNARCLIAPFLTVQVLT